MEKGERGQNKAANSMLRIDGKETDVLRLFKNLETVRNNTKV